MAMRLYHLVIWTLILVPWGLCLLTVVGGMTPRPRLIRLRPSLRREVPSARCR